MRIISRDEMEAFSECLNISLTDAVEYSSEMVLFCLLKKAVKICHENGMEYRHAEAVFKQTFHNCYMQLQHDNDYIKGMN